MKQSHVVIGLIIICAGLFIYAIFVNSERNDLKSDLSALKESIDIVVDKEVNDAKSYVTDSLVKEFKSKPHDTIIKIKIQHHYDTITKHVTSQPVNDQYRWSANELERLYQNGFGVRFKSGTVDK